MPAITYLGSLTFAVIFCLSTLIINNDMLHQFAISTIISLTLGASITQIIKKKANRTRPFLLLEDLYIKKIGIDDYSFPSGHTCAAFSIATMSGLYFPFLSIYVIPLSSLVGISRMYLGVHYPTDVVIGMLIGAISSFITFNLLLLI
ncbi:phosphatase PAP2 family protein [Oceanirhabdus seepicola]|uniref:Phosphatase PAP2 family protein n=2 Tax=Oceanirhabdus seepicola TaxID=2828781 RepID=A0A9J6P5I3_9CLOT|nr:phosphatase PAP2 family protein [Oceanirhabdus seepicola]